MVGHAADELSVSRRVSDHVQAVARRDLIEPRSGRGATIKLIIALDHLAEDVACTSASVSLCKNESARLNEARVVTVELDITHV